MYILREIKGESFFFFLSKLWYIKCDIFFTRRRSQSKLFAFKTARENSTDGMFAYKTWSSGIRKPVIEY